MGRKSKDTAMLVVEALCADYKRQRELISSGGLEHRTAVELRYYSFKIFDAVAEIVGERDAETMIREVGENIGYAKSDMIYISETLYKTRKTEVKYNIARRLHLID